MAQTDPSQAKVRASIMRAGSVSVFTSDEDVYNAVVLFTQAKEQGHAVAYDETFEQGSFVCAHVVHYKTCVKCKEEKDVH